MSQRQIEKKPNWVDDINTNFAEIFGGGSYSDTGWVTSGITFINGASKGDGTPKFRTVTRGKLGITFLSIPVTVPALGAGAVSNVVQLPATAQIANAESVNILFISFIFAYMLWHSTNMSKKCNFYKI